LSTLCRSLEYSLTPFKVIGVKGDVLGLVVGLTLDVGLRLVVGLRLPVGLMLMELLS
jgi:hypothetical protein